MKISSLLFVFLIFSYTLFSQAWKKRDSRESVNYYLKNTYLSRGFTARYIKLISGVKGYAKKDSLLADKFIKKLRQNKETAFYRFMRIRLEWEFKEHLMLSSLDSGKHLLKNNIDSAGYYYMLGIYFKDRMGEIMARRLGFVKVNWQGNEMVDWVKISIFKWHDPKLIEMITHNIGDIPYRDEHMKDSTTLYFKKAIELDRAGFYYMKELILFLSKLREEAALKQARTQWLDNYTEKEKKWIRAYLAKTYILQKD